MRRVFNNRAFTLPPEITILTYYIGLSIYRAALPNYCYFISCRYLKGDNCTFSLNQTKSSAHCNNTHAVDEIETYSSYLLLVYQMIYYAFSIPAIFFSGPLADVKGRKVIILTALLASIISILCFCAVDIFSLHPFFILIPSAIVGVSGNHAVVNLGVAAMSMDLSSEKYRTMRMGVFEGCLLLGSIVSSFLSGVIIDSMGFLGSFAFVVLIWSLTICYVKCIPESLHISRVNRRHKFDMKHVLLQAVTPLRLFKFNKNRIRFIFFLIAYIFIIEDITSLRSIFSLYVLAPPICWGPQYQGYFFGLLYSSRLFGVYLILPLLLLCHVPDTILLFIGALDSAVGFGLAGVYYSMWWLLGVVPASGFLASLGVPSIRSGLSKLVQPTEQASMLTILELVNTISTLASTLFFNALYPTLRQSNAAYSFYIISFTSIVPCSAVVILMGYEYWKRYKSAKDAEEWKSLLHTDVTIN